MHSPRSQKLWNSHSAIPLTVSSSFLLPSSLLPFLPPALSPLGTTTYPGLSLLPPANTFLPLHIHPVIYIPSLPTFFSSDISYYHYRVNKNKTQPSSLAIPSQLLKLLQGKTASKYARNVKIKNAVLKLSWGVCVCASVFFLCILGFDHTTGCSSSMEVLCVWQYH